MTVQASATAPAQIIQRRLVGLCVLLAIAFVLSFGLRGGGQGSALPEVVIPLGGTAPAEEIAAPVLPSSEPKGTTVAEPSPPPVETARTAAAPPPAEQPAVASKPKPVTPPQASPKPAQTAVTKPSAAPIPKPAKPVTAPRPTAAKRWFVVVGAYKDPMATQAIARRVELAGFKSGAVPVTTAAGERLNRVRAGPFTSTAEAESARATLIVEGLTKSVVVSEP